MKIIHFKNKTRSYWDAITTSDWASTNPPWRPNAKEQKLLEELINKNCPKASNCKIALLGATPEIRSILAKQSLPVDVIEYSQNMYSTMSRLSQKNSKEVYFQKDWLSFFKQQKTASYDFVLGDLIFRLLPTTTLEPLLKYLGRSLKKNGRLLFRTHLGKKHKQAAPLSNLIKGFNKTGLQEEKIADNLFFPLSEYFVESNNQVDLKKMKTVVNKYPKQAISNKRKQILQSLVDKWMSTPLSFYVRDKSDINRLMSPFFQQAHIYPSQYDNLINVNIMLWRKPEG